MSSAAKGRADALHGLIENALSFLERASKTLATEPRHAVIEFAIGLELMLKARLCREHWTLIFRDPSKAAISALHDGTLRTVGAEDALKRVVTVCGEDLQREEIQAYSRVFAHRNRALHFFTKSENGAAAIHVEQAQAWDLLAKRIARSWQGWLKRYEQRLTNLTWSIRSNDSFLAAKAELVQPTLLELTRSGASVVECGDCKHVALATSPRSAHLLDGHCRVCERSTVLLTTSCPECGATSTFLRPGSTPCSECLESPSLDMFLDSTDFQSEGDPLYCVDCAYVTLKKTAVPIDSDLVCISCMHVWDVTSSCGWCSEGYAGTIGETSCLTGCSLCDGHDGWDKD